MKKYTSPEIAFTYATSSDILNGSDTYVDIGDQYTNDDAYYYGYTD